jgi:hypothetical protein
MGKAIAFLVLGFSGAAMWLLWVAASTAGL